MSLAGRVALVTGASRGIGAVIARVLAEQGMHVALNARSAQVLAVADELRQRGLRVAAYQADISQKNQVDAMVEQVEAELGRSICWSTTPACCAPAPRRTSAKLTGTKPLPWTSRASSSVRRPPFAA